MKTLFALVVALLPIWANAAALPVHLDLRPPFPRVLLQAPTIERIAPGVEYGYYELSTESGPISVHVVAVNLKDPDVRVGTVLANDVLGPDPETVTSMARRTGAMAGINGDYFDIGRTNHPTNIVVRDGMLIRTPRKRYALAILRNGTAQFAEFSFSGSVQIGTQTFPLGGIDTLPTTGDLMTLITPAFGSVAIDSEDTLIPLQPLSSAPFGTYRVSGNGSNEPQQSAGYYLALSAQTSAAYPSARPQPGDAITVTGAIAPIPLENISSAIGGGPLILHDGRWFDDPDGPRGGAFDHRIPSSGAALEPDGTLLLIEVDGRQPERSIGLTRPQFAALMVALGATDGMALDGGGSSEIAVHLPGEPDANLVSSPSDGMQRRVADGLFVYDTAPVGAAASIVSDPQTIRALPGARVPLRLATVDANDHPVSTQFTVEAMVDPAMLGSIVDGRFVAAQAGSGVIRLRAGDLTGSIPVTVDASPARVTIFPANPNVDPHQSIALHVRAFDANGYELTLPQRLRWSASSGAIDDAGTFTAEDRNADVSVQLGSETAMVRVTVGSHEEALGLGERVRFLTFPGGGPGAATPDLSCASCIRLQFALGPQERAAYAVLEQQLPAGTIGVSFDLQDDGSGALLRIALRNADDEQFLVTATALDTPGQRRVVVHFGHGMLRPARLVGFYVIGTAATAQPRGEIVIGDIRAIVAGEEHP